MERINWSDPTMSGGLFEKIVGCLLGIEFVDTVRIRPGRGDGGVDILAPVSDKIIDVYQLKYFANAIDWGKVEASLDRLTGGKWFGYTIRNWFLTLPKQPTPTDFEKLADLSVGRPFTCGWFAEDRLAKLAADHPEVGDYYQGDGKAQLTQRVRDWDAALRRIADGESPTIDDVQERLVEIAVALGRQDPHFSYGVKVQPANTFARSAAEPSLIVASARRVCDHVVTCLVYPRYRGAVEDAGDRLLIGLELTPQAGQRLAELIALGGKPIEFAPSEILAMQVPVLGHLVEPDMQISARVSPIADTSPAVLRLIVQPQDRPPVVSRITRTSVTPGTEGGTATWRTSGCTEITTVGNFTSGRVRMSFGPIELAGRPVSETFDDIALLRALQPGSTISIAPPHGPLVPHASPFTVNNYVVGPDFVAALDALRVIQDYTSTEIRIPETLTVAQVVELVDTAALLAGLTVTEPLRKYTITLGRTDLGPGEPHELFGELFAFSFSFTVTDLVLPHQQVMLVEPLHVVRLLRSVRIVSVADAESDRISVDVEPGPIPVLSEARFNGDDADADATFDRLMQIDQVIPSDDTRSRLAQLSSHSTDSTLGHG